MITHYEATKLFLDEYLDKVFVKFFEAHDELSFDKFKLFLQTHYKPFGIPTDDPQLLYEANVMYHLVAMKKFHEKVYYVTPKLAIDLANTNLSIDSHFLISPFEQIFLRLDRDLFSITDVATNSPVPVDGIYINYKQQSNKKVLRAMAVSLLEPTEKYPFNDSVFYFKIELEQTGSLATQIKKYIAETEYNQDELKKYKGNINIQYIYELSQFVCNVLLYITSKNACLVDKGSERKAFEKLLEGKKSQKKIRKLEKRMKSVSNLPYIIVGQNIKHRMEDDIRNSKSGVFGKKLDHRVYVSGHWRTQWYGSADSKYQQQIQIEPYYKGP